MFSPVTSTISPANSTSARSFSAFSLAVAVLSAVAAAELSEEVAEELSPEPEVPFPEQPAMSNAARSAAAVSVFFIFCRPFLNQALNVREHYLVCHALEVKSVTLCIFMQEVSVIVREQ